MQQQPNDLARYSYLTGKMPELVPSDQMLARQFLSFSQNELGIYSQAVLNFPLKSRVPANLVLPTTIEWSGVDAVDAITRLATGRRIVLVNEAHHNAHTRVLTLALLPRLRELGFTWFTAETLLDNDPDLMQRGYPIEASGTEYLREPLYGDIVREAIRLGFTVVPYDTDDAMTQARETGQASNLYRKMFAKDPNARLFVHAGYAHIDKARGRLGEINSMAMQLHALTGLDPLSVDQIEFLETDWDTSDAYHQLIEAFPSKAPEVLINRADGTAWSDRPKLYDVNVVLPPALSTKAFGNERRYEVRANGKVLALKEDDARFSSPLPTFNYMQRPTWLTLEGQRHPFPISTAPCRDSAPCVVAAYYIDEPDNAIAADRYAFTQRRASSKLYLRPGRYRVRAWDIYGKTLSERTIQVAKP